MSALERWQFSATTKPVRIESTAQKFALANTHPSTELIALVAGQQQQLVSSEDRLRQAHVELYPQTSACRLAFGGPVEYQSKFRSAFNRLFTGLAERPTLDENIDVARRKYNDLVGIGFELHHNATEHADLPGGSPTRVISLSYNPSVSVLRLEVSDAGQGIVEHYTSSILGGFKSKGRSSADTLRMLLETHESSIPSRSLGGGLPKVLELASKLDANWQVRTNSLSVSAEGKSPLKVCEIENALGTHWEVDINCR